MKKSIFVIIVLLVVVGLVYFFTQGSSFDLGGGSDGGSLIEDDSGLVDDGASPTATEEENTEATEETEVPAPDPSESVLGQSVEGRDIKAYHFGTGETELLFVGGLHGGYSWNTASVAYELIDYLERRESVVPDNVRVTVVPVANPDGLHKTVGTTGRFDTSAVPASLDDRIPGRFNGNGVDLNRNFDCEWQSTGVWQDRDVDGGSAAFSEPESQALQSYVTANTPDAVVVWYAAAGGVFASNCRNGVPAETLEITNIYADASSYPAFESFDFYEITGDMVNWLAKMNIPAISVLLSSHEEVEWEKNMAGIEALLAHYGA